MNSKLFLAFYQGIHDKLRLSLDYVQIPIWGKRLFYFDVYAFARKFVQMSNLNQNG